MSDPVEAFLLDGGDELAVNDKGRRSIPVVSVDFRNVGHGGEGESRVEGPTGSTRAPACPARRPRRVPMPSAEPLWGEFVGVPL